MDNIQQRALRRSLQDALLLEAARRPTTETSRLAGEPLLTGKALLRGTLLLEAARTRS